MDATLIELKLVMDQLGMPTDLSTFNQRFNVQKQIYLAQIAGVDLGYRYGWYLRGPYSQSLTRDAFALQDEISAGNAEHEDYCLADGVVEKLQKAKTLCNKPADFRGSADEWLELLASLHYLRHIVYRPKGTERGFDDAFKLLMESKPQFTNKRTQAKYAWDRLADVGLIESKTLA